MADRRHPNVVNKDEVTPVVGFHGSRYGYERRQLGLAAGGQALGASYMEIPSGKTAWPPHFHCANEEAIFIIQGTGRLRLGDLDEVPVRSGDYIALPAGPTAHQLINDGSGPLAYLALSTMLPTDITVYPETGKIGIFGGAAPGRPAQDRFLDGFHLLDDAVGYWDGDDGEQ